MFLSEGENITSSREAPSPLHQVISFFSPPSAPASPSTKGVEIPLFLQDLFGLEFLPRQEVVANDKDSVSAQQDTNFLFFHSRTEGLLLHKINISGTIPPEFGDLTNLCEFLV
jgi:hypothetical protein